MNGALVQAILAHYDIGPINRVSDVAGGFLSHNRILETDQARFFLKQYRFTREVRVQAAHEAKFFFAAADLPVILPISDRQDRTYIQFQDRYFSLFPFMEGRLLQRENLTTAALISAAELLARLHLAGRNATVSSVTKVGNRWDKDAFFSTAACILDRIAHVAEPTPFDQLAQQTIIQKMNLIRQNPLEAGAFHLDCDHLIHGDYQNANLFYDAQDQVTAIFDFEKTALSPRVMEVLRAVDLLCFSAPERYRRSFADKNFAEAEQFLKAYQALYPLEKQELITGYQRLYWQRVYSLWVETEHYLRDNWRVDIFLESQFEYVDYVSRNLDAFIDRLCRMLF